MVVTVVLKLAPHPLITGGTVCVFIWQKILTPYSIYSCFLRFDCSAVYLAALELARLLCYCCLPSPSG